ncbi:MAG: hypothetical protein R3B84_16990 [Zavarzinella sp.]
MDTTLEFLTSIQADWRYAVPEEITFNPPTDLTADITAVQTTITVASNAGFPRAATTPFLIQVGTEIMRVTANAGTTWTVQRGVNGTTAAAHLTDDEVTQLSGTHPVLYVGGKGGVFRTLDNGLNWSYFPSTADGAVQEGGLLPNTNVTQLNLILGNVNPATGFNQTSTGLNSLLATTFGRGDFVIRLDNSDVEEFLVAPNSGPRIVSSSQYLIDQGTKFAGFNVTFGAPIALSTFDPSDVTITGPQAVTVSSITHLGGNQYRINFASPVTTIGNYFIQVGPSILDFSGNPMDQNENNINGQNPQDRFVANVFFSPNTAPTISNVNDVSITPGTSTSPLAFTVGDAETAPGALVVTATVTPINPVVGPDPTFTLTGFGSANRTITLNSNVATKGSYTVTLTVTDGNGLQTSTDFVLSVNNAPVLPPVGNTTDQHGSDPATTLNLNATDIDGDALTFTATASDPLFDLKVLLGIGNEVPNTFNVRGAGEKYFISSTGTNPAGSGFYILLPDNKLYAWKGTIAASIAAPPIADFKDPSFSFNTSIQRALALSPEVPGTFNIRGFNERYYVSQNGTNPAGAGFFVRMPDDKLYAWKGDMTATLAANPVATYKDIPYGLGDTVSVYDTPEIMTQSTGSPLVAISNPLYDLKVRYGLTNPAIVFNAGANEKFLVSSNNSNPDVAGQPPHYQYFVLLPNNTLVRWNGVNATTSPVVADFTALGLGNVYATPTLLTNAQLTLVNGVNLSTTGKPAGMAPGGTITISPHIGFDRTVEIKVVASDGVVLNDQTQTFRYSVNNNRPVITPIADIQIPHNQASQNVQIIVTDPNPDSDLDERTYSVIVEGANPLYDLKKELQINAAPYSFNFFGQNEYFYQALDGKIYVLTQTNRLYQWDGVSIGTTIAPANLKADFNLAPYSNTTVYANQAQFWNAVPPAPANVFTNRGPLYDAKVKFGLTNLPYAFNFFGQNERFYSSTNGTGLYFLMPNDQLFAWDGLSISTSLLRPPVANLSGTGAYNNPALLRDALPAYVNDPLFAVKDRYGLTKADLVAAFNVRGQNEKYFISTNGSNAANGGYYVLLPNGDLKAWNGVDIPTSPTVANVGVPAYTNTELLYAASGTVAGVTATVNTSGLITLNRNLAFSGTVKVTAIVSDGAIKTTETFYFTVGNNAPTLAGINTQNGTAGGMNISVPLTFNDADGETPIFAAQNVSVNQLFNDRNTFGLTTPAFGFNFRGAGEWYFLSTNGSNAANGGYYVLSSDNKLRAWDGVSVGSSPVVRDFADPIYNGANVSANPALLNGATAPATSLVTTSFSGNNLILNVAGATAGTYFVTVFASDGSSSVQQTFLLILN